MQIDEHLHRVVRRCQAFWSRREPGHFLVRTTVPADAPPVPPLYEFDLERQLHEWLDYKLAAARPGWAAVEGIDHDGIASLCPQFGIAEHAAWLGMEVILQQDTCLPRPIVRGPQDLDRLRPVEGTPWFRYMKEGYDYLRGRKDGSFVLSVRGSMAPMDLANAVRGDDIFEEFLAAKAFVHAMMPRLVDALAWYFDRLLSWCDEIDGGHVFAYGSTWFPPGTVGHLSNDSAMLCGPGVYDEFGFPYEREYIGRYGHALYHVHNEKMHHLPRLSQLPGLAMLEITNDPKTPEVMVDLPRVLAHTGRANLMIHASSEQVRAHVGELKTRNAYLDVACRDRADAADLVAFVRSHSKSLE